MALFRSGGGNSNAEFKYDSLAKGGTKGIITVSGDAFGELAVGTLESISSPSFVTPWSASALKASVTFTANKPRLRCAFLLCIESGRDSGSASVVVTGAENVAVVEEYAAKDHIAIVDIDCAVGSTITISKLCSYSAVNSILLYAGERM